MDASTDTPSTSSRPSLLLIEDDDLMQLFLKEFLAPDYEVTIRGRGDDALEHLDQSQPDAILLDLSLPDTDGHVLLEHLQSHDEWNHIPTLVISSRQGSEARVTSLRLGAEDHLPKPFNPEELRERLELLL